MDILKFTRISDRVWKARMGSGYATLRELSGTTPRLNDDGTPLPFPFAEDGLLCDYVGGRNVVMIPFSGNETLYGLGLGYQNLCRNYEAVPLRCDHYGGKDNGRTHVPTPFYVSTKGYGIFIDTAEYPTFYMGGTVRRDAANPPQEQDRGGGKGWSAVTVSEYVEVSFEGGGADIYVFAGDSLTDIAASFNLLFGGGCMVPKWGLGFWIRTHIRYSDKDVENEAAQYEAHDFPVDVIGLEPGWQSNSYPCTFDWSPERFPDPAGLSERLLSRGIRLNLWENMYISRKSPIYDAMLPLSGSHMVWNGIVPDYTLAEAREIYKAHHRDKQIRIGISGFKIDECDGYDKWLWPDHAAFPSGHSAAVLRQSYGLLAQRMICELYRESNRRTYGLVRASNAGASSFPFCIYNDCYSFREFLNGISTAAFCGTLWVPEVRDAQTAEEWVRRFQLCALSPMLMLNAWANGVKPWKFPEVEDIIRETVSFRRRLLPYLYNAFYTYREKGIPPFRPLCMEFGTVQTEAAGNGSLNHTANPYETRAYRDVTNQFMVGNVMMVCPMEPGQTEREVLFPSGTRWYNFFTGELAGEGEKKTIPCAQDEMLLYVKEGGMIPLAEGDREILVRCFGGCGTGFLYDDDGETFDYERGDYLLRRMTFEKTDGGVAGRITDTEGTYPSDVRIRFE